MRNPLQLIRLTHPDAPPQSLLPLAFAVSAAAINALFWARLLDSWRWNNLWIWLIVAEISLALLGIAAGISALRRKPRLLGVVGILLCVGVLVAVFFAPLPRNMGLP
jgi:hypothetical protein